MLPNFNGIISIFKIFLWIVPLINGTLLVRKAHHFCIPPAPPLHGNVHLGRGDVVVKYSCSKGYALLGTPIAVCIAGKWSTSTPECIKKEEKSKRQNLRTEHIEMPPDLNQRDQQIVSVFQKFDLKDIKTPHKKYEKGNEDIRRRNQDKIKRRKKKERRKKLRKKGRKYRININNNTNSVATQNGKGKNKENKDFSDAKNSKEKANYVSIINLEANKGENEKKRHAYDSLEENELLGIEIDQINSTSENNSLFEYLNSNFSGSFTGDEYFAYKDELHSISGSDAMKVKFLETENIDYSSLDASCLISEVDSVYLPTPRVEHGHVISYRTVTNPLSSHNVYLEAIYECDFGYQLTEITSNRLFCRKSTWLGTLPNCRAYDTEGGLCGSTNEGCEQLCHKRGESEAPACSCFRGFALQSDNISCKDIDECSVNNGGCDGVCFNKVGSYQCFCPKGYRLSTNGKTCVDKNECILRNGHGPCQDTCHNTEGSYYCTCEGMIGTKLGIDNHSCEDVNECAVNNGGCSHICLNTFGQTFCTCPLGFVLDLDWKTCKDINECEYEEIKKECDKGCVNTPGSYYCDDLSPESLVIRTCEHGFEIDATDNNTCQDINECDQEILQCSHECVNTIGSAYCKCPLGFQLNNDNITCEDYNECISSPCSHDCHNTLGSFICLCQTGWTLGPDSLTCIDYNECLINNGNCSDLCINYSGYYQCGCREGFVLSENNVTCLDIDECQIDNGGCHQVCKNLEGEFICTCQEGFELGDDLLCTDIDECELKISNCQQMCSNVIGSFTCNCHEGFQLGEDGESCIDIDECQAATNECSHFCSNNNGSYVCFCPDGWELSKNGKTCEDENECYKNNGKCSHTCVNIEGSYLCQCPPGMNFSNDGTFFDRTHICVDMNECEFGNGNCSHLCINFEGGYRCDCPLGFDKYMSSDGSVDTVTCHDINECLINNGKCSQICKNLEGTFECACEKGYQLHSNGLDCEDIDECLKENGGCSHGCVNLLGSYKCSCPVGWDIDFNTTLKNEATYAEEFDNAWKTCIDIDECKMAGNSCSHSCVNEKGSFRCKCPQGYELIDKYNCQDIDECSLNNGGCFHTCINLPGSFNCECDNGYELTSNSRCVDIDECFKEIAYCSDICINTIGTYICACNSGYVLQSDMHTCKDVNECGLSNGGCSHKCKNIEGKYICSCPLGMVLGNNAHDCYDVDECLEIPDSCSHNCINNIGSFECFCPPGLELGVDSRTCLDINECGKNIAGCSHQCINKEGHYECLCPHGFRLDFDNHTCEDINECEMEISSCDHHCENLIGSYACKCEEGFVLNNDNQTCHDIDECLSSNTNCVGICQNTLGSYSCECPLGLILSENGFDCEDIDECTHDNGGCSHICNNTVASFKCECPKGLSLMENNYQCEDIDECASENPCHQKCTNTHGSYLCECERGYKTHQNSQNVCEDIDECTINNGGCSHLCFNTKPSYYCECEKGYTLTEDQHTCERKPVFCPPPNAPVEGEVHCSRRVQHGVLPYGTFCSYSCSTGWSIKGDEIITCTENGTWTGSSTSCEVSKCPSLPKADYGRFTPAKCTKAKMNVGSHCYLTCSGGYKVLGNPVLTCTASGSWSEDISNLKCVKEAIKPFIKCPRDIIIDLLPGQKTAYVKIPRPKSNVDWYRLTEENNQVLIEETEMEDERFVDSSPEWAKNLEQDFPPGRTVISFVARSPLSDTRAYCTVVIYVRDNEAPQVYGCPHSFRVTLDPSETSTVVSWVEPNFKDNVEVAHVYKSMEPGRKMKAGTYPVHYIAMDPQRNRGKCSFVVTVEAVPHAQRLYQSRKMLVACPDLNGGHPTQMFAWRVPPGCTEMEGMTNASPAHWENTHIPLEAHTVKNVAGAGQLQNREHTPKVFASDGLTVAQAVSSSGHSPPGKWSSSSAYAIATKQSESQNRDFMSAIHQQQLLLPSFHKRAFQELLNGKHAGSFSLAHAQAGSNHDGRQRTSSFVHAQAHRKGVQAIARARASAYSYG